MFFTNASAQSINVIDNKGTIQTIENGQWTVNGDDIHNKNSENVGIGTNTPGNKLEISGSTGTSGLRFTNLINAKLLSTNASGDVVENTAPLGTIDLNSYLGFNTNGDLVSGPLADNFWFLGGNSNATSTSFLGTTNDIKFSIVSNNTSMFEVGRRETLGLYDNSTTGLFPYNQQNASVAYIRGTGGNSSLQFESSAASFYKPVFFTDSDGNFTMRGSSASTDFFDFGSAGSSNNGSVVLSIGDDGNEPIVFQKYNYTGANQGYVEMMRMQGTGLNDNVRVGVNVNSNTPNSTLQVNGSTSTAIITTTGTISLNETHHTVILGGNHLITLPVASTCTGRTYIIKNPNDFAVLISPAYVNLEGASGLVGAIDSSTILKLQSDGTNWQQISDTKKPYEKIVIWAEEGGGLADNSVQWSYGNGASGFIGIPLPETWEAYAVSFHADNTSNASNSVSIQVVDINANNSFIELFRFTATGADDNMVYTEILSTPITIPAGTALGFRTLDESGAIQDARVAVWLRRYP